MPAISCQSPPLTDNDYPGKWSVACKIPSYTITNYSQVEPADKSSFVPPEICSMFQAAQTLFITLNEMGPEDWREVLEDFQSPTGIVPSRIGKGYGPFDNSVESCVYRMALGRERTFSFPLEDYRESDGDACGVPVMHISTEQNDNAEALNAWASSVRLERNPGGYSATFPFLETLIEITGRRKREVFGKFKRRLVSYAERLQAEEPILI